jgi:PAS domain S-box-containing protein
MCMVFEEEGRLLAWDAVAGRRDAGTPHGGGCPASLPAVSNLGARARRPIGPSDVPAHESAEEQFRLLFAASPDAMVLIDPHDPAVSWPIVDCNDAACRMNGYSREDLLGRSIDILNATSGTPEERMAYLERLRREGVTSLEADHRRKGGEVFPVEVSTSIVVLGERELVLGVDRDISERRRAHANLLASYEELRRADEERGRLLGRLIWAHEEEKVRIADELHDDSIQVLTAVGLRLSALRSQVDPSAEPELRQLEETISAAQSRLRLLLFELRPPSLDRVGLFAALAEYAERVTRDGHLSVDLEGVLDRDPFPNTRVLLYRLAQEALTNVRKHAKARRARLTVGWEGEGVLIRITDDGIGLQSEHLSVQMPGHVGLISMRERAELAGGWFRIESQPGRGTTVSFWIPDSAPGLTRHRTHQRRVASPDEDGSPATAVRSLDD